ncbi:glycosyltransferase [Shewanella maritima]|uniref:Glycosyltransferase n=1 Tax=Shewanella maritima TaxID=2520507 RepID=A0A411PGJ8_9GAMM|nr:glycosyltransferase family 4 protein [Shewanella maritima]QBF82512.1 glycosyltransferase [Shewanella maritima]
MAQKPLVVHCVDDNKMGGVNMALTHLCQSHLSEHFDMRIVYMPMGLHARLMLDADIICFHGASSWTGLLGVMKLKLKFPRAKLVLQEHHYSQGFVDENVSASGRFYQLLKFTYGLMDKVISIAPSQQRWMLKHKLASKTKIAMLGQGRDLSQLMPLPETVTSTFIDADLDLLANNFQTNKTHPNPTLVPINPSAISESFEANASNSAVNSNAAQVKLLAYGRFHCQKGFDVLLKAMALIPAELCQLTLIGEGELQDEFQALAEELSHVQILPAVDNIATQLLACDAVVIPSRWEPFGLVMQEALSMGKCVIASDVDGLHDQFTDAPCVCVKLLSQQQALQQPLQSSPGLERKPELKKELTKELSPEQVAMQITSFCKAYQSGEIAAKWHNDYSHINLQQWRYQQWQNVVDNWHKLLSEL